MRKRLVLVPVLAAALAVSLTAQAATKTLDGKKTKSLSWTVVGSPQTNDPDLVLGQAPGADPERVHCKAPRCAILPFTYAPAKGVKAKSIAFQAAWTTPVADIDLYVAAVDKYGDLTELGHCGAGVGTSEKVWLEAADFKPGKKYAVVVDFYRTADETVKVTAVFNGADTRKEVIPAAIDELAGQNCGQ